MTRPPAVADAFPLSGSLNLQEAPEPFYMPSEIAALWRLNVETIRRLFQNEPGVMVIQAPTLKGKPPYKTIRIPHSVLERVRARLQR